MTKPIIGLPFLEQTTPPPFYQAALSEKERVRLDKAFIGTRSQAYYLKEFAKIDAAGKLSPSFNWAAFVSAFGWLLYRRRFLDCFVYCVAGVSFIKLTIVISLAVLEFLLIGRLSGAAAAYQMSARVGVGVAIWLFWAYQVGRWANAYYYRVARREIADALALYPNDKAAQTDHLAATGGVSMLGLAAAFALFAAGAMLVRVHFFPFVQTHYEQQLIYDGARAAQHAKNRVNALVAAGNACPVDLPLSSADQQYTMQVQADKQADEQTNGQAGAACSVVLTFHRAGFPIGYLNGHTIVMRFDGQKWWCETSLPSRMKPVHCEN